ncbi:MAG TPA: isochorismate synthase [Solirubrobacteraceae bacterium]|nr:isochorismate synthase [Solirubrobacteraceae bacterium]
MHTSTGSSAFALSEQQLQRLTERLELAVRQARRTGRETLAALTVTLSEHVDPSAVVCASRRAGEPWFVFEQPERGRSALGGLGEVVCLNAHGPDRFATVAAQWRALSSEAASDPPEHPDHGGPIAMGGFAFAGEGGAAPGWSGFDPASLVVPEVTLIRSERGGRRTGAANRTGDVTPVGGGSGGGATSVGGATPVVRMTLAALAAPDDTPEDLCARLQRRLGELRERALPLLDPAPSGRFGVSSVMPPEHYEAAVARAVELIRAERFEKIVLAREVQVNASSAYDPAAVFGVLRAEFPSCFVFCVGRGDATLVAASPELLVRREGQRVSTLALAGSTRRSADPAVDDHLGEQLLRSRKDRGEQAIVVRRIERTLHPHALWVTSTPEPTLVRVANIQHLATPIRAQLARPLDAIELLELMHPTPAVGGEPFAQAEPLIPALEGLDRGWYAGPVGWIDTTGDGEFCVALRCALLRGAVARCYAGVGVVRDSDPASELAETEIKLAALLPLLAG